MPPQLPPSLGGAPPMGSSPMAVPTGNAGAMANAQSQIRAAYDILAKALGSFPMGSDLAKKLGSVLTSLNSIAPPSAEVPGVQQTTAAGLNQDAQKNALIQMLGRIAPAGANAGGGGPTGAPGAPPTPPPATMPPSLAAA